MMLDGVEGDAVIADKAYDSNAIRDTIKAARMKVVIPSNRSRKRCIRHDKALYRERNRIERCFNKLKHFRRLATRYDRRARHFLPFLCLPASMLWMRSTSIQPRRRDQSPQPATASPRGRSFLRLPRAQNIWLNPALIPSRNLQNP